MLRRVSRAGALVVKNRTDSFNQVIFPNSRGLNGEAADTSLLRLMPPIAPPKRIISSSSSRVSAEIHERARGDAQNGKVPSMRNINYNSIALPML